MDGSYKRVGEESDKSPQKRFKESESSDDDDEVEHNGNGRINIYNTKSSSSDSEDIIDDIANDEVYDPINE